MFAARILVEVILVLLLAYGFWHEGEVAAWERVTVRKIKRKWNKRKSPSVEDEPNKNREIQ